MTFTAVIRVQNCPSAVFVALIDLFRGCSFADPISFQNISTFSTVGAEVISFSFLNESFEVGIELFILFKGTLVFLITEDCLRVGEDILL